MIQRIQTVYLLLAFICSMISLSCPAGYCVGGDLNGMAVLYNLWVLLPEGGRLWQPWALFALQLLVATLSFLAIFLYRRRMLQIRFCTFGIVLLLGWYIAYGVFAYLLSQRWGCTFRPDWTASLPFASIVFLAFAWRGIFKDELLVKSLDRLR